MIATTGRDGRNGEKSLGHSIQTDDDRLAFESQVRECFGRCAYTHKTHEKMADREARHLKFVKWGQIVLSALTAAGAVGILFKKDSDFFPYVTVALAVVTLILSSYVKDLNPGETAQKHREAASDIWNVREAYLSLLTDIRDPSLALESLRKRRDDLQISLHKIYRSAPHTDGKAYGDAQDALKNREDLTFNDGEIDQLLPDTLRRSRKS
jgi:hypothetical protein